MIAHESPLNPLLRFLLGSFRVGKFFGTEVRVYGAALIFVLLVALPLARMPWLGLGDRLLYVVLGVLALYLTVYVHEMGHALGARRYHIRTPLITLSPLGGLAHMQGAAPNPRADIFISAAGPVTHLLTLAVVWPLSAAMGSDVFRWAPGLRDAAGVPVEGTLRLEAAPFLLDRLVELNLGLLLFNLLPLYPLDGGRIFRSLLAMRMHPNRATLIAARIGMVGAVLLGLSGLFFWGGVAGGVTIAIAITNFMACQRAVLEARHSDGPYGERREPWEEDPDAWKYGAPLDERSGPRSPSAEPTPRPRARPTRERDRPAPAEDELDRLLDRVREVGVSGLTPNERAALQRAAEARKSR